MFDHFKNKDASKLSNDALIYAYRSLAEYHEEFRFNRSWDISTKRKNQKELRQVLTKMEDVLSNRKLIRFTKFS